MSRSRRSPAAGSGGVRVALRPLTEDDLAAVKPWYEEAVAATMGLPDADAQRLAIVRVSDRTVLGLLGYRVNNTDRGVTMGFIAVARGQRGWGYGSEAVRLLEAEVKAQRFRASVDARNGLGLYFWLRLGYRPARPDEVPGGPQSGIMPMMRIPGGRR